MTTLEQIETRAAKVASVLRRLGRGACPRKPAERAAQALHDCWETESRRPISEKTQLSMLVYEQYRAIELPSFRGSEPYASRAAEHISAPVNIASAYCERLHFLQAADILKSAHPALAEKLQRASPHWMRHSHASHALARGAGLTTVRDNLRHASIATTSMYLHGDDILRAREINQAFGRR